MALKRSEVLAQDDQAYREALARVEELRGDVLPHLVATGQELFQESPHTAISDINRTSIPQAQLVLTQPLFSGFREFLAFKAGKRHAGALELSERRAESLLYRDVSQAYFNLLAVQNEVEIRRSLVDATRDRIRQLERWIVIGRSRESEALAARSLLAQDEAQVEIARGQEQVGQEALRFLTGLEEDLLPAESLPPSSPATLETYIRMAGGREDVEAARREREAAELTTKVYARQRWPTIGLTADYYIKRTGFQGNVHYDAILAATLPLFDGGVIAAQTDQAKARERSADAALSLAERSARRDVRQAYRSLTWTSASVAALEKAAKLAERNVEAQEADYRRSLVTNLDVLDSLNVLQSTRLQLNAARQQNAEAWAELDVAAGGPKRAAQVRP